MTLQPVVENAIKHGVKQLKENSIIEIKVKSKKDAVQITIRDNGIGIEKSKRELLGKKVTKSKTGTGIGLFNVNRRLEMMYGEDSQLLIESKQNEGTTISFYIPSIKGEG